MQAVEEIREQLSAAELHVRALLADAIARIELRLSKDSEERDRRESTVDVSLETLQRSVISSATDVTIALGQVSEMCAIVAERIEADRLERRALTDALALLVQPASRALDAPSRSIGGTVFGPTAISGDDEISIVHDEPDPASPTLRAEVIGDATTDLRTVLEGLTEAVYHRHQAHESRT